RLRRKQNRWQINASLPLAFALISLILQQTGFALLCGLLLWLLPEMLLPYIIPLLVQQYLLSPAFWLGCQALIAALLYLHNKINGETKPRFSNSQLLGALFFAMLLQTAYLLHGLSSIQA
ncbi:MAG: hypothetical protein Q4D82_08560, partial [Neisseria sp.]|nr:hypothetical protein [Neisseria sp.]